jgi:hypothetical protein
VPYPYFATKEQKTRVWVSIDSRRTLMPSIPFHESDLEEIL